MGGEVSDPPIRAVDKQWVGIGVAGRSMGRNDVAAIAGVPRVISGAISTPLGVGWRVRGSGAVASSGFDAGAPLGRAVDLYHHHQNHEQHQQHHHNAAAL
jgi:hypothetical protein